MKPIVGYHLILTAYGFWLPNDPRGSWSDFVRSWELFRYGGPVNRVWDRRSHARDKHDRRKRLELKKHLARNPIAFTGLQARAIARGFARFAERSGIVILACAIMPDHVHLVILTHKYSIEKIATLLKGAATADLIREGLHPFKDKPYKNGSLPTPWARKHWKVFLHEEDLPRACKYADDNPPRGGVQEAELVVRKTRCATEAMKVDLRSDR